MERIGVIAGTPVDTQMGVEFLEGKGRISNCIQPTGAT